MNGVIHGNNIYGHFFLGYETMRFIVDFHLDSVFNPLVCVDKDLVDDR